MARITKEQLKNELAVLTEEELVKLYAEAKQEAEDNRQTATERRQQAAEDMKRIKPF